MDLALRTSIEKIGFSENEAAVLIALFEMGSATAAQVAKRSELNRSTAYVTLSRLVARGYVTELPRQKVKQYVAADPGKLLNVGREHLENFKFLLPVFRAMYNGAQGKPRIEFFEGREAIQTVWQEFGRAREARYLSSYAQLRMIFGKKIDNWIDSALSGKTKTVTRQILPDESEGREFAKRIIRSKTWDARFLPKGASVDVDVAVVDDVLALTSFDPLFIVVIHSAALAKSIGLLFDIAWRQCQEAKKKLAPAK